jgi:cathepsin B
MISKFIILAFCATAIALPFEQSSSLASVNGNTLINDFAKLMPEEVRNYTVGVNEFFNGMTFGEAKFLLGTDLDSGVELPARSHSLLDVEIPESFDSRTQWPNYIHPIRDQAQCGSCWAFAASEALSDRFAIATNGKMNEVLSPQDMVECDSSDNGCQGGILANAWNYLKNTGIVTDKCMPYVSGTGSVPKCNVPSGCTKYKAADAYTVRNVADIQKEIMASGPVEAGFKVYKSFMSYKSGVYHKGFFELIPEGGHAVKIVGWGVESGTDYWMIANSWTTKWGLDGFFKIKRGNNECGIEGQVYAGHAAV